GAEIFAAHCEIMIGPRCYCASACWSHLSEAQPARGRAQRLPSNRKSLSVMKDLRSRCQRFQLPALVISTIQEALMRWKSSLEKGVTLVAMRYGESRVLPRLI